MYIMNTTYFNKTGRIICLVTILVFLTQGHAQIGVGTQNPQATLDVRGADHDNAVTAGDGILIPRVNSLASAGSQNGQLVYLIADVGSFKKGFHYWNGSNWQSVNETGVSSASQSLVEPDTFISGSVAIPVSFPNNTVTFIPDGSLRNMVFDVSGSDVVGNITLVTITMNVTHGRTGDLDIFLWHNGLDKKLELSTDNGFGANYTNTTFADAAPTNITAGSAPFTGSFRPEGTLTPSGSPVNLTPNITTLAGFNGLNPTGRWRLSIGDDSSGTAGSFISGTLNISGDNVPVNWVSLGEVAVDYYDNSAIIVKSTYSGDPIVLGGITTALTRSNATVAVGTSAAALPGTVLSYASDSPTAEDAWVNTTNIARDAGLTNNTTYYYQLWRKGTIQTPVASHETFSLVPLRLEE